MSALDVAIGAFIVGALLTTAASLVQPAVAPISPVPVLVALAAFCVAALARHTAPSLAWLGAIGGSFAAGSIPIDLARAADPGRVGVGPWLGFALPASAGAIVTLAIAARYATRPDRRLGRGAVLLSGALLAWLVVACALTIGLIASGLAQPDPAFTWIDVATAPITAFVPFVVALTALGIVADVRAGVGRARERLGLGGTPGGPAERAWALAVATGRELVPGQSAADEASLVAERTRLAGDLHAVVLPSLRRAIAEAETGGDPDILARHLRAVDVELERLMADRWPVVLDAFGLIPALEELAERIEADGGPSVTLEIGRVSPERPPRAVERTAWRVAQVALDNAVRHAGGTAISIVIATDARRVRLVVEDDGRGFDPSSEPVRDGARGLADAGRRAASVGAAIRIERGSTGGTSVAFDWSRPAR